jgi:F420H(2)-dependent quinone reductase
MGEVRPYSARQEAIGNRVIRVMSRAQAVAYRATGGRFGSRFLHGAPVGILTHMGRRTGEVRRTPLIYVRRGDDVVVAASKGGFSGHPAWYWNLTANPDASFQIGGEDHPVRARPATAAERPDLWALLDHTYRDFATYRDRAAQQGREIALFVLEPR